MNENVNIVCPHCDSTNKVSNLGLKKINCGKCEGSLLYTKPIDLNSSNFSKHIKNNDIPVLIHFWTTWCMSCKMMAPVFEEVAKEYALKVRFAKIDIDSEEELSAQFKLTGIPTFIILKNGVEINRTPSVMSHEQLRNFINANI